MKKYKEILPSLFFLIPFLFLFFFHLFDISIYIFYFILVFPFLLIKFSNKKYRLFYFVLFYSVLLVFVMINLFNGSTNLIPFG